MTDKAAAEEFDFEGYRRFIGQLALRDIWLVSAKIENRTGPDTPERARLAIAEDASWEAVAGGFRAAVRYRVRFRDGNRVLASVEATFAVDYASAQPMTSDFFGPFREANLPLNTWPYLREFLANAIGRMGWTPFTLPAFKVNVDAAQSAPVPRGRSSRRRSPKPSAASDPGRE